jgi:hypothetical protein
MKMTCQDALSSISVMRRKEETDYRCEDYILNFSLSTTSGNNNDVVDALCRKLMADWCLKVVDRCHFMRDTAAIAMNLLDRFLMTEAGAVTALANRNIFQLASMTCLYTAIKVHESEALQPETIVQLSRGIFTVKDIEQMELSILFAIQWRTNPPTALAFCQYFMEASGAVEGDKKQELLQLAQTQTEMVINDYSYVWKDASSIAYAALSNAVELLSIKDTFLHVLANLASIDKVAARGIQMDLKARLLDQQDATPSCSSVHSETTTAATTVKTAMAQGASNSGQHSSPREVRFVDQQ